MNQAVLVIGPQGIGKTLLAPALMAATGTHYLMDEWDGGEIAPGTLALSNDDSAVPRIGTVVLRADSAEALRSLIARTAKAKWLEDNQRAGETYAGLVLGEEGEADYHVFLLPGELVDTRWKAALAWAEKIGGVLPNRREQRLLWVNAKAQLKPRAYWSSEQHAAYADCAWYQDFDDGNQYYGRKSAQLCARAIRRSPL